MKLDDIATRQVVTIRADDLVDAAIALMEEHDIHHLPVVGESGSVVGIVSDRDVLAGAGWLSTRERIDAHDGSVVGPRKISEMMSAPVQTLSPDDPVEKGAQLLFRERFGAIPLVADDVLVGIVSESDVLKCYLDDRPVPPAGTAWRFRKVSEEMAANLFSLRPNDGLHVASRLLRDKHVRHIPVAVEGRLLGIVSDRDIRKAVFREEVERRQDDGDADTQRRRPWKTTLREVMTSDVETVGLAATVAEAADRMVQRNIGALPVLEDRELVGIISETDLLRNLAAACEPE